MLVKPVGSISKYTQAVRHLRPGAAYTDVKAKLAEPIGHQIFDKEYLLAGIENAFDLFRPTVTFRLFANINHRFFDQMGNKRSVRNAGGLASGDDVDFVGAYIRFNHSGQCGNDVFTLGRE